ncbi:MAG: sigma-70 family RNA polymerase sigma factor [Anaerolineae bacterium]
MSDSEEQLVQLAKGDANAFGQLYERYVDKVYSYIFHRVGNQDDAEDLTSRAFQRAMVNLGAYVDRGVPFSAWLFRIAHNLVANWHRDQRRRPVLALDELIPGRQALPETAAEVAEEEAVLMEAIRSLPADRQTLLIFKFGEGLSNAEIAHRLGRSEGAVKSLYHRTLLSLREELERRGWNVEARRYDS